jgi:hypothetical protein
MALPPALLASLITTETKPVTVLYTAVNGVYNQLPIESVTLQMKQNQLAAHDGVVISAAARAQNADARGIYNRANATIEILHKDLPTLIEELQLRLHYLNSLDDGKDGSTT